MNVMRQHLLVANRYILKDWNWSQDSGPWLGWKTCIRSMAFGHVNNLASIEVLPEDTVLRGQDAYQYTLEVICGLHSPVVGETEVYGQFKKLFTERHQNDPKCFLSQCFYDLNRDAKQVRSQHLIHLGCQSYGSLLRKKVRNLNEVHFVGAGLFVRDLLPWIHKSRLPIHIHVRQPQKVRDLHQLYPQIQIHRLDEHKPVSGALVIAAPMRSQEIIQWLRPQDLHQVFDLRGESTLDPIPGMPWPLEGLKSFFDEIEKYKAHSQDKVQQALGHIQEISKERTHGTECA